MFFCTGRPLKRVLHISYCLPRHFATRRYLSRGEGTIPKSILMLYVPNSDWSTMSSTCFTSLDNGTITQY